MGRLSPSLALILLCAGLAGCAEADAPLTTQDALATGLGAISGVLVDDRFRPVELTEGRGRSEFQAEGFILIEETGDQLRTSPNGEFESPPLTPGTYSLRFTIEGHEATPQTVAVSAGEVAEPTIVARRTLSNTDVVLQYEFGFFIDCAVGLVVFGERPGGSLAGCIYDGSGESDRFFMRKDLGPDAIERDATFLVNEILYDNPAGPATQGTYRLSLEGSEQVTPGISPFYYAADTLEGRHDRVLMVRGELSERQDYRLDGVLEYVPWVDTDFFLWRVFGQGLFYDELRSATDPVLEPAGAPVGGGVGVQFAITGQFLVSFFFTDDARDVEDFCGLCGDLT